MPTPLGTTIVDGWAAQAAATAHGFSSLAGTFFRLDGPIEVEDSYDGLDTDPIQLFSLDSDHRVPIEVSFVARAGGDPTLADNTLRLAPHPSTPLRSGERYVALLTDELVRTPENWERAEEYPKDTAFATTFTVQDSAGQSRQLAAATDRALEANPEWLQPATLRRVVRLTYTQGETPNGNEATIATSYFEEGDPTVTYLFSVPDAPVIDVDLLNEWPMEVWETEIQTVSFRDLTGQPWSNSGPGLLLDFSRRHEGWIDFDPDGDLIETISAEPMRVVIQVPKTGSNFSVMTWDHGTGGHAYSAVQRVSTGDAGLPVATAFAEAGTVVVSRDQPLYGTRYSLIEDGYGGSLGFYNIGNLPAFRDNQRQAGVAHRVLHHFVEDVLPGIVDTDPSRVGAFGHSLGSVTAHNGLMQSEGTGASKAFMSGTGGYFTYYVLATGLLGTDNDVVAQIEPLVGVDMEGRTASELVAILAGLPEPAWPNMDRMHPVMGLFQLIMDPADPMVLAPEQSVPETLLMGVGDWQVPNITTEWLDAALPDSTLLNCEPLGEYDPHYCTYREDAGVQALSDFVKSL